MGLPSCTFWHLLALVNLCIREVCSRAWQDLGTAHQLEESCIIAFHAVRVVGGYETCSERLCLSWHGKEALVNNTLKETHVVTGLLPSPFCGSQPERPQASTMSFLLFFKAATALARLQDTWFITRSMSCNRRCQGNAVGVFRPCGAHVLVASLFVAANSP